MGKTIISMYITLTPVILTGIFNMIFCTSKLCKGLLIPLDGGKTLKDGKRLFGDNKTLKGLIGYFVIGMITTALWGGLAMFVDNIENMNYMYVNYNNTLIYNTIMGASLGLGYALFELPNSFLKRRFDIVPGRTANGYKKWIFILIDQCDSIIGCVLVILCVYPLSVREFFLYILLGIITHLVFNVFLYVLRFRKTII